MNDRIIKYPTRCAGVVLLVASCLAAPVGMIADPCETCIANIPALTHLQDEYGRRGLVVIGNSWEKPESVRAFVRKMEDRMRYVVVADPEEVLLSRLNALDAIGGYPYAFPIGGDGKVVWAGHPEDDGLAGAVARTLPR